MRSRYSAFALGARGQAPDSLTGYLLETWHPRTRPEALDLDPVQRWFRLDIIHTVQGRMGDVEGTVEFRARFRQDGSAGQQHEVSRFLREQGRWFYLEALALE